MIDASLFLQLLLYILGSILLVVLIILGVKLIITMNKIENIVDDINGKVRSLNGIFSVIDMTTDKLALLSDKTISFISDMIKKVFNKRKESIEDGKE